MGGGAAVYIETIFILNLVMDLYLLTLTCCALRKTISCRKIIIGATIGATGYCAVLSCRLLLPGRSNTLPEYAGMLLLGAAMVKYTCSTKGFREQLYGMGYLFTFSFLMGGFILYLKTVLPGLTEYAGTAGATAGAGFLGFAICRQIMKHYARRKRQYFCKVELLGDNGPISVVALVDTGNGLREPVSSKPVAILSETVWQNMQRWKKPEKYKVIPFHSIGKNNGLLEGYVIEEMEVKGETGRVRYEQVIIAVSSEKLSGTDSYQMILPPELAI